MFDFMKGSIQGFVKIIDTSTQEVLVDVHNDILYGNISTVLANALIGNPSGILNYMAFGNGGAYIKGDGQITYKPSLGGIGSLAKQPIANLYNTIYVKKIYNNSTSVYYDNSKVYVPTSNISTNYEDIVAEVTLDYTEPSSGIQQSVIDNSTFVGTSATTGATTDPNEFVFNEIGLFAGTLDIFIPAYTETTSDVDAFVEQGMDFSMAENVSSKLMITHVIFHPIQKSANRSLQILYTLRIQMGNSTI